MPIIMCSYCHYLGSDSNSKYTDYDAQLEDVIEHEKTCEYNLEPIEQETEND